MAKTSPWHSKLPNDPYVYHNDTDCNTGNNIEEENRVEGTEKELTAVPTIGA